MALKSDRRNEIKQTMEDDSRSLRVVFAYLPLFAYVNNTCLLVT